MLTEEMKQHLFKVYGSLLNETYCKRLGDVIKGVRIDKERDKPWDENDVFLITYGDTIQDEGEPPLKTLHKFLLKYLKGVFSTVHILPFFPYSSDDGFAVEDFYTVNPNLGSWQEINAIAKEFRLMADLVVNHASSQGEWFQQFLMDELPGRELFFVPDDDFDLSRVVRPRSSPLITNYQSLHGVKKAWTTFSADQVDLNYANPELLLEVVKIILWYIKNGVRVIRLDAIAFIWKESGTPCVHLFQTHEIVKFLRCVVDYCAPGVILITETNVPHNENISYYGDGNEAHMVYQFPLPPLLLYTLNTANAIALTKWALSLDDPGEGRTWFNFTASHDGIGVRPLEGLISKAEKSVLVENMINFGALVSNRRALDGSEEPYEINISYFDALKGTGNKPDEYQIERFLCSQTIMLALKGVPAVYIQSLFGAKNDYNSAAKHLKNRAINRQNYTFGQTEGFINETGHHAVVFKELKRRIAVRKKHSAFHPDSVQEVIDIGKFFFAFLRHNHEKDESILSISNISSKPQIVVAARNLQDYRYDLISGIEIPDGAVLLNPYQTLWLTQKKQLNI